MATFRQISTPAALAAALACAGPFERALAQAAPPAPASSTTLTPVVITGKAGTDASVAGWGGLPLAQTPIEASSVDAAELRDAGARRLADLVRFDAAVTRAYESEGYVDYFTVRGFVIDNRFNFRRDGLPINAETSIPLENKARIDILKGLSGSQAGTSAPGGLVDLVVKRPLYAPLRSAFLEWRERGSVAGAVDLSQRFGIDDAFGLRLNAGAERIDPQVRDARGHRHVLALAGEWRAKALGTLAEAEIETSRKSQPSAAGFSLLGPNVPAVPDPRLNLNDQPWSLPIVFGATTASLRLTQRLGERWRVVGHVLEQRLRNDDRVAFPFGCTDPSPPPDGTYYADRFCPDGTYDLYDFRSDGERRRQRVLDVALHGSERTGGLAHEAVVGVQRSLVRNRFRNYAYNFAGTGRIDGTAIVPPNPDPVLANTDRDERSSELYARDRIAFGERTSLWLGARFTRLSRSAAPTDGSPGTSFRQSFTTPFAAVAFAPTRDHLVYASWGRGVESDVAPNVPLDATSTPPTARYLNAGQALPAARSRQVELGWKGSLGEAEWSTAVFDIRRPLFGDVGACGVVQCLRGLAGEQRHRGIEAQTTWRAGAWQWRAGAQWLHARVERADDPSLDGKRPPNVPALTARAAVDHAVPGVLAGLHVLAAASYESAREVVPDNSARIPSVTRVDAGLRRTLRAGGVDWTLRAGVDNVFDRRAWRESPYQFSHAYLFPLEPRTWRFSLQADL